MEEQLRELGMSEKEVKVFLNLVKNGCQTVNNVAITSQLPRSSAYDVLKSLTSKGVVNSFLKEKKTFYQAIEPEQLLELEENRIYGLRSIIPKLKAMQKHDITKSEFAIYTGMKGVLTMLDEVYSEHQMMVYGSGAFADKYLKYHTKRLAMKRVERKIHLRMIMEKSIHSTFRMKNPLMKKYTKLKIINEMVNYPAMVFITKSCVAIVMMGDENISGVLLKNHAIITTQKYLFEFLWKIAKPYDPEKDKS